LQRRRDRCSPGLVPPLAAAHFHARRSSAEAGDERGLVRQRPHRGVSLGSDCRPRMRTRI
jgi:hypothetical protein